MSTSKANSRARFGKITLWDILYSVGFCVFFSPMSYAVGGTVFRAWRLAVMLVALTAVLLCISWRRISLRWTTIVLFTLSYYFMSKIVNSSDGLFNQQVYYSAKVIGFVSLLDFGLERHPEQCLNGFLTAGVLMCGVHYVTFLRYRYMPFGMKSSQLDVVGELSKHPWFFLTHDNGSVFYFLPVMGGLWYRATEEARGLEIATAFTVLTIYMYWALNTVTAMVVTVFAAILMMFIWRYGVIGPLRALSYRRSLLLGFAFCLMVVILQASGSLSRVATLFNKSTDLGRGYIWTRAVAEIRQRPLYGVGFESDATTTMRLLINHCHNIVLQVMYTGGAFTMVLLFSGLFVYDTPGAQRASGLSSGQAILNVTILSLLVASTFDWYLYMSVMFYPFIAYRYTVSDTTQSQGIVEIVDWR